MGFWVKLDDGTVVSYQDMADYNYSFYDKSQKAWIKAPPEIEEKAKEKLIAMAENNPNDFWLAQFMMGINQPPQQASQPKPKPKRKELMREIAILKESVESLLKQLSQKSQRVYDERMGELEHHLTLLNYEVNVYRKIIREAGNGVTDAPTARQLFKQYFGKDISEFDVETSREVPPLKENEMYF